MLCSGVGEWKCLEHQRIEMIKSLSDLVFECKVFFWIPNQVRNDNGGLAGKYLVSN